MEVTFRSVVLSFEKKTSKKLVENFICEEKIKKITDKIKKIKRFKCFIASQFQGCHHCS
ncbi:hypothetical protein MNB_SV-8-1206 [hydrothermal vent metagenome]|uniref:Uncharacterized protein n=1 Tax=hydrothermal vent metagenome TaxID=652676 RepID=A0A1W1C6V9_9ZZZZ